MVGEDEDVEWSEAVMGGLHFKLAAVPALPSNLALMTKDAGRKCHSDMLLCPLAIRAKKVRKLITSGLFCKPCQQRQDDDGEDDQENKFCDDVEQKIH